MTNPQDASKSQNMEAIEASYDDIQAAAAVATEGFTSSIGGVVAIETGTEAVPVASLTLDRSIQTVGRRKRTIAHVILTASSGKIVCNDRELEDHFPNKLHQQKTKDPPILVEHKSQFDVKADINGGGPSDQAGALCLAIARALSEFNSKERDVLEKASFLTRDARVVGCKKAGLHKARHAL